MKMSSGRTSLQYAVITADVVNSRKVVSFRAVRDRKLKAATALHTTQKLILSPYTITAWDEFQTVMSRPEHTPRIILDLRRIFHPLELRIAVGIGHASGVKKNPINVYAGGEAFERAREAADLLQAGAFKFRVLTRFETGNETLDTIANTIYGLQDSLLEGTSARQWETVGLQLETGSQEKTAKKLKVDISTVSRNLKRGHYWQLLETARAMEAILMQSRPIDESENEMHLSA
jgi:hypothetical protein